MNPTPGMAPVSTPVPLPQRPIGSRLSTGHVLTLLIGLVAAVLSYAVLRGGEGVDVALAARDLGRGEVLTNEALRFESLRLGESSQAGLLTRREAAARMGRPLLISVERGELLATSMVARAGDDLPRRIPIRVETIPFGLARGDLVDVYVPGRADPVVVAAPVWEVERSLMLVVTVEVDRVQLAAFSRSRNAGKFTVAAVVDRPARTGTP